jgi:hypothetical protein
MAGTKVIGVITGGDGIDGGGGGNVVSGATTIGGGGGEVVGVAAIVDGGEAAGDAIGGEDVAAEIEPSLVGKNAMMAVSQTPAAPC